MDGVATCLLQTALTDRLHICTKWCIHSVTGTTELDVREHDHETGSHMPQADTNESSLVALVIKATHQTGLLESYGGVTSRSQDLLEVTDNADILRFYAVLWRGRRNVLWVHPIHMRQQFGMFSHWCHDLLKDQKIWPRSVWQQKFLFLLFLSNE
jgi:hypothetical protein